MLELPEHLAAEAERLEPEAVEQNLVEAAGNPEAVEQSPVVGNQVAEQNPAVAAGSLVVELGSLAAGLELVEADLVAGL